MESIVLSEISKTKKEILHVISYPWNLKTEKKKKKQTPKKPNQKNLIKTEKRNGCLELRSGGNRERLVKGYNLSVIR